MTDNEEIKVNMLEAIIAAEGLAAEELDNLDLSRADEIMRRMDGEDIKDILEDMANGN